MSHSLIDSEFEHPLFKVPHAATKPYETTSEYYLAHGFVVPKDLVRRLYSLEEQVKELQEQIKNLPPRPVYRVAHENDYQV